jgi:hypothetical protein
MRRLLDLLSGRPLRRGALLLLAFVFCLAPVPAARADHIDVELLRKASEILAYLEGKGYKNVGILRFQLQKGRGKADYSAAMITNNMVARLETALLMEIDPDRPIGIIHDASNVAAAKAPGAHWSNSDPKQRAALFDYDYPLAWGDKKVKADAFLLGRVKLSEDMRTTTVLIACFDRKTNEVAEVTKFDVKTDRSILGDSGQSFVLSRSLVRKRSAEARDADSLDALMDADAVKSARDRDEGKGGGAANDYLDFEVRYDGQPQQPTNDPSEGGELRLAPPRPGQTVMFVCKNRTDDDIGLVVFVNGRATLEPSVADAPDMCCRWVLPRGRDQYAIRGYLDEGSTLTPFKIVGKDDDVVKNELAEKLGLIEVHVFLKGQFKPPPVESDELLISRGLGLRSLSPRYKQKMGVAGKPHTAAEAQARAYKSRGLKPPKVASKRGKRALDGGFIVPDPELREELKIPSLELPNPTHVSIPIVIRYNDRPGN